MFRNRRRFWAGLVLAMAFIAYMALDSKLVKGEDGYAVVGRSIDEYAETLKLLTTSYYKPLASDSLTASAIQGMLEDLDPYTQFLDRRAYEELMIDTRGKFGGLGITISRLDSLPVVMSVIEGTPADKSGLVVGDRIIGIDGEPTVGKLLQEVVDVLRGDPDTQVTIRIDRTGRTEPFDQPIVRARISVKSVQYTEPVEGVGYIAMSGLVNSRFSETTPDELEDAIQNLLDRKVKGLILDLRANPGGLLSQAVAVADKFLDEGLTVVTTKGRISSQDKEYRTESPPIAMGVPLVVLVNGYSASASEIVAGAIQDSDRGLILGTPTFGKGSVQSFRQVGIDKALKWTTALYYTPSGRSIHKGSRRFRPTQDLVLTVGNKSISAFHAIAVVAEKDRREDAIAELMERFDLDNPEEAEQIFDVKLGQMLGLGKSNVNDPQGDDPNRKFKTAGGRTVYGGGGITPDVEVEQKRRPRIVVALRRAGLFFDFAVHHAAYNGMPEHPDSFAAGEKVLEAFRSFLADSTNTEQFSYRTAGAARLSELEQSFSEAGLVDDARKELDGLRRVVAKEREREFDRAEMFIRMEIERALANRLWGTQGRLLISLRGDQQFEEAVKILNDPQRYEDSMKLALVPSGN
jgi:carboxyl-terminal processing protease